MNQTPALDVRGVDVSFKARFGSAEFQVLHDVSFTVARGETLGVVGESGCGKSTLARVIAGLQPVKSGTVTVGDREQHAWEPWNLRSRPDGRVQLVFQDSQSSLDPRGTVFDALVNPLFREKQTRAELRQRAQTAITATGLDPSILDRRPSELSGGQAQRVGIARALIARPELIVLDEPTSALDVTVQAQVLQLIKQLADEPDRSFVFISHDLATVRNLCDRVMVLYLGRVVEIGTANQIFSSPLHPYTRALLSSVPRLRGVSSLPPVTLARDLEQNAVATGCPLAPRCPFAVPACAEPQELREHEPGHWAACHRAEEITDMLADQSQDRSHHP